jgi:hypothetical protein
MPRAVTIEIAPNDKYRRVLGTYTEPDATETDESEIDDWPDDHQNAADDYIEFVDEAAVDAEEYVDDVEEIPTVSWDDISPSSDPDIIAKVATYFEGMDPSEPTDLLRAKCRLLDVDIYIDAQLAATAELRETA